MGTAAARGARKHVMVGVRHFALNSMESLREDGRITCDEKTMNELFLQHFKDVLCESGAEAVLSAGNLVNGVACAENPALLNGILRERWGLDDLIVASDCTWPVKNGPASIKAGLDLEMPFSTGRTAAVENALEHGTLDWTQIEVLAQRIVSTQLRYYCRMINVPLPRSQRIRCQRHVSLARQSVAESMVLLKNDNNFLPLSASSNLKLTVLGVLADRVSTAHQFDVSSHAQGPPGTSPLEELRKRHNLVIDYMENNEKSRATKSASTADAVIIFLRPSGKVECVCKPRRFYDCLLPQGQKCHVQHHKAMTHFRDRSHLTLHKEDLRLAREILSLTVGKVVVVIEAGTTVTIPAYIRQKATSILFSSYGCRQYGKGLRDVLFGEQEPSGRLPFVLPDTEDQLLERSGSESSSHEFRYDDKWGYRKLQHEQQIPAYPFGFGLGYSTFTLTSPWYERPVVKPSFDMTVNATNTGNRVSAVVVQVYASRNFSSSSSSASSRRDSVVFNGTSSRLIGFAKELVKPGENVEIAISCRLSPLAEFISATGKMAVAAGEYGLVVCQHEGDRGAVLSSFRISGEVLC
jgi:beta-glucosidase